MKRRSFVQKTTLASVVASLAPDFLAYAKENPQPQKQNFLKKNPPIAICTWRFEKANLTAGRMLDAGATALDAVIAGVSIEEQNLKNMTVGMGGATDREGEVSLDAAVMDENGDCGAVVYVKATSHVAALARKVMEETPHVMLAGQGADDFAGTMGFEKENLVTKEATKAWEEWKKTSNYKPIINIENHDTIGMLAIDKKGNMSGACTTSGLSYKMKGRVGDSPIIGSGLYIDNAVGGAAATGMGEEILKVVGCFLIVELMRNGSSPQEACEEAVKRTIDRNPAYKDFQVAYIAMDKEGNTGSYCIHEGFTMMRYQDSTQEATHSKSYLPA